MYPIVPSTTPGAVPSGPSARASRVPGESGMTAARYDDEVFAAGL
jgi:hypothetical protein